MNYQQRNNTEQRWAYEWQQRHVLNTHYLMNTPMVGSNAVHTSNDRRKFANAARGKVEMHVEVSLMLTFEMVR